MTVENLIEKTGFNPTVLADSNREIDGVYIGDLLSWVMGRAKANDAWITIMQNRNVLAVASLSDTACVIFAEGVMPDEETVALAREKGVNLLSSPQSAYHIAKLLFSAL